MKKNLLFVLLFLLGTNFAQLNITSFSPENNAVNIPTETNLTVTFSEALDTNKIPDWESSFLTNIDSIEFTGYSGSGTTLNFQIFLNEDSDYFFMVMGMKSKIGSPLAKPAYTRFTTASAFSGYTVSGNVVSGSSGVSPDNALIGLSAEPLGEGTPNLIYGTTSSEDGSFSIPNVKNGLYYIIAAKDADGNGMIDPGAGIDVISIGDSITVNEADITGLEVSFAAIEPIILTDAFHMADSIANADLPEDKILRMIRSWSPDTLGNSRSWEFLYTSESNQTEYNVRIEFPQSRVEEYQGEYEYHRNRTPIDSATIARAVLPTAFMNLAEENGGKDFRNLPEKDTLEFEVNLYFGDLRNTEFYQLIQDSTDKIYWGISYIYYYGTGEDDWTSVDNLLFLIDPETGNIVDNISDVKKEIEPVNNFTLYQNYPNPFNPSTTIQVVLNDRSDVTLTIYNILGQKVATLFSGKMSSGLHNFEWKANDNSGIYFYRIDVTGSNGVTQSQTKKMILLK